MTVPTQHNCPHSPDGWCLACVGKLAAERDAWREIADRTEQTAQQYLRQIAPTNKVTYGQVVFKLPPVSAAPAAQTYVTEGFQANQHCKGRGANPYPDPSRMREWWDQGWCEAELCDVPEPQRTELERYLAGGNE
jgi:hypothetical protein